MDDAIGGLGGGGLSTPYLSNAANAAGYATSALVAFFGGPLIVSSLAEAIRSARADVP
jgi:hypothetical protein